MELPHHAKLIRNGLKRSPKAIQIEPLQQPFDPHEEELFVMVLMLIGMRDIGPEAVQHSRDRGDQPFLVRAGNQKNSGFSHGKILSRMRPA
ncbi:MAG: hypothetical protein JWQ42_2123 [Edaphobacter sp.]|nr:hypothetical protein [Edaphobacter sp.]